MSDEQGSGPGGASPATGDWQPGLLRAAARYAPDPAVALRLAAWTRWPAVADYDSLLTTARLAAVCPGLTFVLQAPRPRRRPAAVVAGPGYNESIVAGAVPTRSRSWHDLFNGLVWSALPATKLALHRRQHELIQERLGPPAPLATATDARRAGADAARSGATVRSRREDTLAMIDEGGLVLAVGAGDAAALTRAVEASDQAAVDELVHRGTARAVVCGHALLEHLARGQDARGFAVVVTVEPRADLAAIDEALAAVVPGVGEPGGRPGLRVPIATSAAPGGSATR